MEHSLHRPTQPGHPSVDKHNEYWRWSRPTREEMASSVIVGPVIRTAVIPHWQNLVVLFRVHPESSYPNFIAFPLNKSILLHNI